MRSMSAVWVVAVGLSVLVTGACGRGPEQAPARAAGDDVAPASAAKVEREMALVRVLHAIPGDEEADVFAGEQLVFPSLEYRTVTSYQELPAQQTTFRLRPKGQDMAQPLAEGDEFLAAGRRYTIIALPSASARPATIKVLPDDLAPPAPGKAGVRVVNASPDAGRVAVFVGATKYALVRNVSIETASDYIEAQPTRGTVEVRSERNIVAHIPDSRIEAGTLYTVFLLGRAADRHGLQALLITDRPQGLPL